MRSAAKVGLVVAGYVAALLLAFAIVAIHIALTSGSDRDTSSGMYVFGDLLLFLGGFTVAALAPTGALLWLLRPYR